MISQTKAVALLRFGIYETAMVTAACAFLLAAIPHKASAMGAAGTLSAVATAATATGGAAAATTATDDDGD